MPNAKDCVTAIRNASDLISERDANELLARIENMAKERVKTKGVNIDRALKDIEAELALRDKVETKAQERAALMQLASQRRVMDFARRFPVLADGILAINEGTNDPIRGARLSIDQQTKAYFGKYLDAMFADLEEAGVLRDFTSNKLSKQIAIEMFELRPDGKPGISGSPSAAKIATILEKRNGELIAHLNRAGANIRKMPGYITMQTHDMLRIREAGGGGHNPTAKADSFKVWSQTILPLLDSERTFQGQDPQLFLRKVHENLYNGHHSKAIDPTDIDSLSRQKQSLSARLSAERVLHFKDGESFFKYNQVFGTRDFRDQVVGNLHQKARALALMETYGPNPRATFERVLALLKNEVQSRDDSALQIDSLKKKRLEDSFRVVSAEIDNPSSVSLAKWSRNTAAIVSTSKMGGVVFSSVSDVATAWSEAKWEGGSGAAALANALKFIVTGGDEAARKGRTFGVGMEGLMGEIAGKYSIQNGPSNFLGKIQRTLFRVNFLNEWTNRLKAGAAWFTAGHLGEHSHLEFEKLPTELQRLLKPYEIDGKTWDVIRKTAWETESGGKIVSPDKLADVSDVEIGKLVEERGLTASPSNIQKQRDLLENKLRVLFSDRADIAVITPGAKEKRILTAGTQAGTREGEFFRLLTMFKAFPTAYVTKILGREVYGRGNKSLAQFMLHDNKGAFHVAQLVAMTTVAGWVGMTLRDMAKGRTPRLPYNEDGSINGKVVMDSMARGGGMGIYGDFLFSEYDRSYRNFLGAAAGPVFGQLDPAFDIATRIKTGQEFVPQLTKFVTGNTPYANLFYIRPALDYLFLWNLQEMLDPGSLRRMERSVEQKNNQDFFIRPSEVAK